MSIPVATAPLATGARRPGRRRVPEHPRLEASPPIRQPVDLEALSALWQRALDAADRALRAASHWLPEQEVRDRRTALAREAEKAAALLSQLRCG